MVEELQVPALGTHPTLSNLGVRRTRIARLASYLSFLLWASWNALTTPKPDVVVTLTTPPLLSLLGTLIKRLRGCKHFIWEMDLYPDVAVAIKVLRPASLVVRLGTALVNYSRNSADGILALGECMRDRLIASGIPASAIHVTENWADSRLFNDTPMPDNPQLRVLYSGNLGLAHDVDTIETVMWSLRDDRRFQFVFAGGGARRKALASFCERNNLEQVALKTYSSRDQLGSGLASGHIGLVTQSNECLGLVVPSKVYGLLAAGRPILFIGPKEATPARIIQRFGCGWQLDCGDARGVVTLLQKLARDRSLIEIAGRNARQAFLAHYDLTQGVLRISTILRAA